MREDFDVRFAMTYGEPRIDKVIAEMKESGVGKLLFFHFTLNIL